MAAEVIDNSVPENKHKRYTSGQIFWKIIKYMFLIFVSLCTLIPIVVVILG